MSIFTDFDASYSGEYFSGIPTGDGSIDIFSGSTIADKISPAANGFVDGDFIFNSANAEGGVDTFVNGKLTAHTQENIFGGEDYLATQGNTQEILSCDDPLKYVQNLRFDPFEVQSV